MDAITVDIRVRHAEDLRAWWLDGFPDGGLFVPGVFSLAAGSLVQLRLTTELPTHGCATLDGTVVWRRMPTKADAGYRGVTLPAGIGVAFDPTMRARVLFLERLARGAAKDIRRGDRYPTHLEGELAVRPSEHQHPATVQDVSAYGALLQVPPDTYVEPGAALELFVAPAISGETQLTGLPGRVAWASPAQRRVGMRLSLSTREQRLHWAKLVTLARREVERRSSLAEREAG